MGIDPYLTAPQTVVLPLHYSHHMRKRTDSNPHGCYTLMIFKTTYLSFGRFPLVTVTGLEPIRTESKSVMLTITSYGNICSRYWSRTNALHFVRVALYNQLSETTILAIMLQPTLYW